MSDKEIEARAVTAFVRALSEPGAAVGDQKPAIANVNINYVVRAVLEAAARVRAEADAEPVAWRYKLFESDPEWTVTTKKPKGVVVEPLFTRPSEQAVTEVDEKLPCDVQLPGVKLKRGARLSTLLMAIRKRKDWPEEQTKLPRMPVAARPTPQPGGAVKALEWVASDDWEYRWTADLYAIEDQGKNWSKDRYWLYYNGQRLGKFGTLDVALFVAQADYERRILSALISSKPEQGR